MKKLCPCASGLRLARCCLPYLTGASYPSSALTLMRSRYTAHCRGNQRYLLETTMGQARLAHQSTRQAPSTQLKWQRLEVVRIEAGEASDRQGLVEFRAYFQVGSRMDVLHEVSHFEKISGRWFYVDGESPE